MGTWRHVTRDTEAIDSAAVATRRVSASYEVAHALAERAEAATERAAACEESFMQWPIGRLHQLRELVQP